MRLRSLSESFLQTCVYPHLEAETKDDHGAEGIVPTCLIHDKHLPMSYFTYAYMHRTTSPSLTRSANQWSSLTIRHLLITTQPIVAWVHKCQPTWKGGYIRHHNSLRRNDKRFCPGGIASCWDEPQPLPHKAMDKNTKSISAKDWNVPEKIPFIFQYWLFVLACHQWPSYFITPASRLLTQLFIQAQIKEYIKAPRHWPLWEEFTGEFLARKCSHLMTQWQKM